MITDELRKQLTDYAVLLIKGGTLVKSDGTTNIGTISAGSAKVGLGGNSTSPAALDIDVPSGATIATLNAVKANDTVFQAFVEVDGTQLTGLTIREFGLFDSNGTMLSRLSFSGISSIPSTDTLQLFLTMEVR